MCGTSRASQAGAAAKCQITAQPRNQVYVFLERREIVDDVKHILDGLGIETIENLICICTGAQWLQTGEFFSSGRRVTYSNLTVVTGISILDPLQQVKFELVKLAWESESVLIVTLAEENQLRKLCAGKTTILFDRGTRGCFGGWCYCRCEHI